MAALPCALLCSCAAQFPGEELLKQIIGVEELPANISVKDDVIFYPWTIDNKYYSAIINFCVVSNRFVVTPEIADSLQAFIIYFDSTITSGLDSVSAWLPLTEEWLPDVLILVCDRASDNGVNRQRAQEWCIKHGFELVELNPEDVPDEDDDFPETTGVKRIVQALNANVWSNVKMKNDHHQGFGLFSTLAGAHNSTRSQEAQQAESDAITGDTAQSLQENGRGTDGTSDSHVDITVDPVLDTDIQELASLTAGDGDLENFSRLFTKLQEMKDKAATLPHEQRKLHAEKVAKAFWMAIGGDEDEVDSLSSDEEH
ncbi:alpha- and gamma-adaptin-binding protein p34 isoform X2 [Microcaecilia unicolor]|uniref:Alpha- and gamma-adaptin-binding protein p34 isoform X2 n=1 Tax=Microcaecilia unicolor TaxID=1415580 RepID=A0A6P7X509_9AMPH|nr:alpha- and gamma-adaptin-binding protein p34 isoform X2 [Microcaecilia unicolor]